MGARQRLIQAWADFEECVAIEARDIAEGMGEGDEECWNDTLNLAERVEGFASMLDGRRECLSGELIATMLKADAFDREVVDAMLLEAGMGWSTAAPGGAWAIALGIGPHGALEDE